MASYQSIIDQKESYISYNLNNSESTWRDIKSNALPNKISKIIDISPKDQMKLFGNNSSSFMPLDPLYGYHGEFFQSSLSLGPIEGVDEGGFYNFHNPITFYNPANTSLPREKIHSSDSKNFHLFINRKQPKWELPLVQKVGNYITFASLFLVFLYMAYTFLKRFKFTHS